MDYVSHWDDPLPSKWITEPGHYEGMAVGGERKEINGKQAVEVLFDTPRSGQARGTYYETEKALPFHLLLFKRAGLSKKMLEKSDGFPLKALVEYGRPIGFDVVRNSGDYCEVDVTSIVSADEGR